MDNGNLFSLDIVCHIQKTNGHTWRVVGRVKARTIKEALGRWRKSPGAFGPTCATARIKTRYGEYTVGGNCLAVTNHARDRFTQPQWLACYADRNAARKAAEDAGGVGL